MTTAIYLTPEDRDSLRTLLRRVKNLPLDGNFLEDLEPPHQSPEVYIAKTPEGGIPPLCQGRIDIPGNADCEIYRVNPFINNSGTSTSSGQQPEGIILGTGSGTGTCFTNDYSEYYLESIGYDLENVLNLSLTPVTATYILVTRDKFGSWIAEKPTSSSVRLRGVLAYAMRPSERAIFTIGTGSADPDVWNRETGEAFLLDSAANPDKHAAPAGYKVNMIYDSREGDWCVESVERVAECIPTGELRIGMTGFNTYADCNGLTTDSSLGTGNCNDLSDEVTGTSTAPNEDIGALQERVKEYSMETAEDEGVWRSSGVRFVPVQNVVGFYDEDLCTIIQTQIQFVAIACATAEATGPCGEACTTGTA